MKLYNSNNECYFEGSLTELVDKLEELGYEDGTSWLMDLLAYCAIRNEERLYLEVLSTIADDLDEIGIACQDYYESLFNDHDLPPCNFATMNIEYVKNRLQQYVEDKYWMDNAKYNMLTDQIDALEIDWEDACLWPINHEESYYESLDPELQQVWESLPYIYDMIEQLVEEDYEEYARATGK